MAGAFQPDAFQDSAFQQDAFTELTFDRSIGADTLDNDLDIDASISTAVNSSLAFDYGTAFSVGASLSFDFSVEYSGLPVVIRINDVIVTQDVDIATAQFVAQVNGNPGTCNLRVRDDGHTYEFTSGGNVDLVLYGRKLWGGYLTKVERAYPLKVVDTTVPSATPRYWNLAGVDYNIFFTKRVIFDESNPAGKTSFDYPVGTYDDTIIADIFDNYLDLSGTGVTRDGVERVSIVTLDIPGVTSGKGTLAKGIGQVASAGYTWKQTMDVIARATGAVYYIDPDRVLHYVDVDTADAAYGLSDAPDLGSIGGVGEVNPTQAEDDFERTSGSGLGTGGIGTWTQFATPVGQSSSVSGGKGHLTTSTTGLARHSVPIPSGALAENRIHYRVEVTIPSGGTSGFGFQVWLVDLPGFTTFFRWIFDLGPGDIGIDWETPSLSGSTGDSIGSIPASGETWVFDGLLADDYIYGKAWKLGDDEPGYQVISSGVGMTLADIASTPSIFITAQNDNVARTWDIDNFLFEYGAVGAHTGGSLSIIDDKNAAVELSNPHTGLTTVTQDVTMYTLDATDPAEFEDWTSDGLRGPFSGWIKLVLDIPATLKINTFGSSMLDTILFLYAQDTPPGSSDLAIEINDDSSDPLNTHNWSQLYDTRAEQIANYPAGTYWIAVLPYDSAGWDTGEATVTVNITRYDTFEQTSENPVPDTFLGYQKFNILVNGSNLVNDMLVWGSAPGSDQIVFSRATDSASIAEHNRWQGGLFSTGLYHQASADLVADSYLNGTPQSKRGGKRDAITVSCRVFEPVFRVGEKVDTVVRIFDYEDVIPIRKMTITFVNPSEAIFDLVLSHEIDLPWSIFEAIWPPISKPKLPPIKIILPPLTEITSDICQRPTNPMDDFSRISIAPVQNKFVFTWTGNVGLDAARSSTITMHERNPYAPLDFNPGRIGWDVYFVTGRDGDTGELHKDWEYQVVSAFTHRGTVYPANLYGVGWFQEDQRTPGTSPITIARSWTENTAASSFAEDVADVSAVIYSGAIDPGGPAEWFINQANPVRKLTIAKDSKVQLTGDIEWTPVDGSPDWAVRMADPDIDHGFGHYYLDSVGDTSPNFVAPGVYIERFPADYYTELATWTDIIGNTHTGPVQNDCVGAIQLRIPGSQYFTVKWSEAPGWGQAIGGNGLGVNWDLASFTGDDWRTMAQVDGGYGILRVLANPITDVAGSVQVQPNEDPIFAPFDFYLSIRFGVQQPTQPDYHDGGEIIAFTSDWFIYPDNKVMDFGSHTNVDISDMTMTQDMNFHFKWDATGLFLKWWQLPDEEPDAWMLSDNASWGISNGSFFFPLFSMEAPSSSYAQTMWVGKGCIGRVRKTVSASAFTCKAPTKISASTYDVGEAYYANSSFVVVDGLVQSRGAGLDYVEDPTAGLIVFTDDPDADAIIRVCYVPNGVQF